MLRELPLYVGIFPLHTAQSSIEKMSMMPAYTNGPSDPPDSEWFSPSTHAHDERRKDLLHSCHDLLKKIRDTKEYAEYLLGCLEYKHHCKLAANAVRERLPDWKRFERERKTLRPEGEEIIACLGQILDDAELLESELLPGGTISESIDLYEFQKFGVEPGTYTDHDGIDLKEKFDRIETELNLIQERLDEISSTGSTRLERWESKVTSNEDELTSLTKLTVYRLLRDDEKDCQLDGIKRRETGVSVSPVEHVLNGSQIEGKSFISVTKDIDVALFLGSKAYFDRGQREIRIAVIELDVSKCPLVLDFTSPDVRIEEGFDWDSREDHFARCFKELLVPRDIEANEIKGELLVQTKLPRESTFSSFIASVPNIVCVKRLRPSSDAIESVLDKLEEPTKMALEVSRQLLENHALLFPEREGVLTFSGDLKNARNSNIQSIAKFGGEHIWLPPKFEWDEAGHNCAIRSGQFPRNISERLKDLDSMNQEITRNLTDVHFERRGLSPINWNRV